MTARQERCLARVAEYLKESEEVWPDAPPPMATQIRDALDCAAEPITLAEVEEALLHDALDVQVFRDAEASDLSLRPRAGETAADVIERVTRAAKEEEE